MTIKEIVSLFFALKRAAADVYSKADIISFAIEKESYLIKATFAGYEAFIGIDVWDDNGIVFTVNTPLNDDSEECELFGNVEKGMAILNSFKRG